MLICEERCSDGFRDLAAKHGWGLLEGIGSITALHACVAIEPDQVCVELVDAPRSVPDIVRRLAALDSIGRVGCLIPGLSRRLESSVVGLGAAALTTVEEAEDWLSSTKQAGGAAMAADPIRSSGIRVQRRARLPEWSAFPCE